ncbi:MAG: hypothetical protein LBR16_09775 [Treponema sp.]|jgi:hypothetical protein|nr:hypothetical protein [Treponema sp.]
MKRRLLGMVFVFWTLCSGCTTINRVRKNQTLYFVGAFTNWTFEPMTRDMRNPAKFRMGRFFTWKEGGNFKFGVNPSSWKNMYHPAIADAPYDYRIAIRDSADDHTWRMKEGECGRAYKMVFDTSVWPMRFDMTPFDPLADISMEGDAVEGAARFAQVGDNRYVYTWRGPLKRGRLVLTAKDDSRAFRIEPWKDGLTPDGTMQQIDISETAAEAAPRAWQIETAGLYTIILDQLADYIVIERGGGVQ